MQQHKWNTVQIERLASELWDVCRFVTSTCAEKCQTGEQISVNKQDRLVRQNKHAPVRKGQTINNK